MNPKNDRDALAYMITCDESPFGIVENDGFKYFASAACPNFKIQPRSIIRRDCYQLYLKERKKLKLFLKDSCQRVCVSIDNWTSRERVNYTSLTAHFIDNDWKLQKRILNFCPISGREGEQVGKYIEGCLLSWGLDGKLFTVTVDDASSNDVACNYLKTIAHSKGWVSDGKYLQVRCFVHFFHSIVWDCLKEYKKSVNRVRNAIKYVMNSPKRLQAFKQCVEMLKIDCNESLSLDVPTRWNSTYLMLDIALKYRRVFDITGFPTDFDLSGKNNEKCVDKGSPMDEDWANVASLVTVLEKFYNLTNRVSATFNVTCNTTLFDITTVWSMIKLLNQSDDVELKKMAYKMRDKFDKYRSNVEKMNMLVYFAIVLVPKYKMEGVKFCLDKMHGEEIGRIMLEKVQEAIHELFDEYNQMPSSTPEDVPYAQPKGIKLESWWLEYEQFQQEMKKKETTSELGRYLNEGRTNLCMDILLWWELNSPRFPVLGRMARDILAMPISTVTSESAFSIGGRHLDAFKSSLLPKMTEALICGQDWIRHSSRPEDPITYMKEILEELEEFEKELPKEATDEEHDCVMYS